MHPFGIVLAVLVAVIALVVVRAVRLTRGPTGHRTRDTEPRGRDDIARDLVAGLRAQVDAVKCPRCQGSTFMVMGTEATYKCEVCHLTFDGPPHPPVTPA